jgi:hypothetical protein
MVSIEIEVPVYDAMHFLNFHWLGMSAGITA